jgi:hypothetical protein
VTPTGPHVIGTLASSLAAANGGLAFTIDLDPRWVKKLVAAGQSGQADAYAEHLIDQAGFALRTQDVGAIIITPPLLDRLARRDDLVELVNQKVAAIAWAGAHPASAVRHRHTRRHCVSPRRLGPHREPRFQHHRADRP